MTEKTIMKKVLSYILVFCMVVTLFPMTAFQSHAADTSAADAAAQELRDYMAGEALVNTNGYLKDESGNAIATIYVDNETNYVDVCIDQPDYPAMNLLYNSFLAELFNHPDIDTVLFADGVDPETEIYTLTGNKVEDGIMASDQFNLMLRAAYHAMAEEGQSMTDFMGVLNTSMPVGTMDGSRDVPVTLVCSNETAGTYTVDYTMSFFNRNHDVNIHYMLVNGEDKTLIPAEDIAEGTNPVATSVAKGETFTQTLADFDEYVLLSEPDVSVVMDKKDIDIYAEYALKGDAVTIKYEAKTGNGDYETVRTDIVAAGAEFDVYTAEDKEGYTFSENWTWYNSDMEEITAPEKAPDEATTIYARGEYVINKHILTYIVDGETVSSEEVEYGTEIDLTEPEKEGYTFSGWKVSGDTSAALPETMPDKAVTLIGTFSANDYTIMYMLDGKEYAVDTVKYGEAIELRTVESKTGHTFSEWAMKNGEDIPATMPAQNLVLTGSYIADTYVLKFNVGGTITELDGTYGQLFSEVAAKVEVKDYLKDGYDYKATGKWLEDGTAVAEDAVITGEAEYTAEFTKSAHEYTITYMLNDEVWKTEKVAFNDPVELADYTEEEGYTFSGWAMGADEEIPASMPANDITVTATYKINSYGIKILFGSGSEVVKEIVATHGTTLSDVIADNDIDPTVDNGKEWTFTGWVKGTGAELLEAATEVITGEAVYTAKYEKTKYTVSFYNEDGTVIESQSVAYGAAATAPTVDASYEKDGVYYKFIGWKAAGDSTETLVEDFTVTGAAEYTAVYTDKVTYTVTFYNYDGTELDKVNVQHGKTAVYSKETPVRQSSNAKDYTFNKWVTSKGGSIEADLTSITADTNVYASYSESDRKYTVTYVYQGGAKTETAEYTYMAKFIEPDIDDLDYEDAANTYKFTGWNGEFPTMVKENMTFVAQYESTPKEFTVVFDVDGVKTSGTYKYNAAVTAPDAAKAADKQYTYEFLGWKSSADGKNYAADAIPAVTADVTYTAQYKSVVNEYTVTFCNEEGTVIETQTVKYGSNATAPAAPAKADTAEWDYTFAGWENAEGKVFTKAEFDAAPVEGDMVLTANYSQVKVEYTISWSVEGKITETKVAYGEMPDYSDVDTDKASTPQYKWTFTGWSPELVAVTGNATYTAQYEQSLNYVARLEKSDGTTGYYKTVEEALAASKSGDDVIVDANTTITKDCTVPQGVTLLLPCQDGDSVFAPSADAFNPDGTKNGAAVLYRTVNVDEGVTVTVSGTLIVNAVTGRFVTGANILQDNSGGYAQMNLNGDIVVAPGGLMDVSGFVKGSGKVTALSGSTVYDLYVIQNWRGGGQAAKLFLNMYSYQVYPMNEADCHNIEVPVVINHGASYEGSVKMCANASGYIEGASGPMFCYARFPLINTENGLIRTNAGAYVIKSYQNGKEVYDIYGDTDFVSCKLTILGQSLTTSTFIYPFDGTNTFNIHSGTTAIKEDFKLLPGASITVKNGAELVVEKGYKLALYKEFNDAEVVAGTAYSSGTESAVLTLEKGAAFTINGSFGGKVIADVEADITIGDKAKTTVNTYEAGLDSKYVKFTHVYELETVGEVCNHSLKYTYNKTAKTHTAVCSNGCGYTEAAVKCTFDSGVITKQPTASADGVKTYTCSVCGGTYTEVVEYEAPTAEVDKNVYRIYGSNRYATSLKAAKVLKSDMGVSKFDNVIIASGATFADALPGSYLAAEKDAPILLIDKSNAATLKTYVKNNLKSGGTVYVLGGTGVIPDSWVKGMPNVRRLGGTDRYATNLLILKEAGVDNGSDILVCTGTGFADSLSASATGKPILLVGDKLNFAQQSYLKTLSGETYYMIGGTGAVSNKVMNQCKAYGTVGRVYGNDRYATSVAVAKKFFGTPDYAVLAYGLDFPDGLSAGPLAYNMDAPLILTATGSEKQAAAYAKSKGIKYGYVIGGPALISDKSVKSIFQMSSSAKIKIK